MVWLEVNMSLKNPVTTLGIDPGTVRLVAQRLNHYATPEAVTPEYTVYNSVSVQVRFELTPVFTDKMCILYVCVFAGRFCLPKCAQTHKTECSIFSVLNLNIFNMLYFNTAIWAHTAGPLNEL